MDDNLKETAKRFSKLATRLRRLGSDAAALDSLQISPSQLTLLEYVAATPGCGVQEVAEGLNLATPTVSISIRQLEKNGLLTRKPDPNDGRAVQLFLTQTGTEIYQRAQTFHQKKFEQLLKGLSIAERDTLVSLLEQAIRAAEEKSQGDSI